MMRQNAELKLLRQRCFRLVILIALRVYVCVSEHVLYIAIAMRDLHICMSITASAGT